MFMTGAAIWALVALLGAVAWSHPGPRRAVTLAEPPAASASRVPAERSVKVAPAAPPVQSAAPPVQRTTPRRVRQWTPPPPRQVRRAPVVRVLPRYVAPVTSTQTS
jgi:hypothetical protein